MKGADLLVRSAAACGIDVCFANPGTTEMALVKALEEARSIRTVLGLFEGVCSGAADGYGRIAGKPALMLLHQGPGLANAVANLHNTQRARTPVVNMVGDHFTWHRALNPSFYLGIETIAAAVGWCRRTVSPDGLAKDLADALQAARRGQIATLIVPHDHQLDETKGDVATLCRVEPDRVDQEAVEKAADLLRKQKPAVIMLGGKGLGGKALRAAARIRSATGCGLFTEILPSCWERGAGLPAVERTPYRPGEQTALRQYKGVILAGLDEPVTFSGRQGVDSRMFREGQEQVMLSAPGQDVTEALERLADTVGARANGQTDPSVIAPLERPQLPHGPLTLATACQALAALQPEGAIVVEEGITSCYAYYPVTKHVAPHTLLTPAGGTIGWGVACALGAALAAPHRPVIAFVGDGSAMYAVQGLWTQAREGADVTTLILSNRAYNALRLQLGAEERKSPGPVVAGVTELTRPEIGWVQLSRSLGVPAVSVATSEAFARELRVALSEAGPHLIELVL